MLQELEGRSTDEIAAELEVRVPVVRQLIFRARERLRTALANWSVPLFRPDADCPAPCPAAKLLALCDSDTIRRRQPERLRPVASAPLT